MPAPKSSIQPAPLHLPQVPPDLGGATAAAENAGSVEFDGRLGERKIAGAKARLHSFAEKLLHEIIDGAGEIAEGDVSVDGQPFDLVKHERVRGVGIVAAIHLAGNDDAYRRLALFHGVDLHGRSVRAQKQRPGRAFGQVQVKGVHIVADGMMFRNVQRFEIVIRRFDFRAFDDGKADREENVFDFLENLANQVMRADGADDAGERKIDALFGCRRSCSASFDFGLPRFDLSIDVAAEFVQCCADRAFQFRCRGLQPIVGD